MSQQLYRLRNRIHDYYRREESLCVIELIHEYQKRPPNRGRVASNARELVTTVRSQREGATGVDHLMHEFSLSSEEGVALMCVAEALLRIPDSATADRLIRDKLSKGAWESHLGSGNSMFVSAATWGLMITGKLVATRSDEALGNALVRLVARCGEPVIRKGTELAMQLLGRQFVMGESIGTAIERSKLNEARGYTHSFDMLGEAALTNDDAERFFLSYRHAIEVIGRVSRGRGVVSGPGISVKLSALHPRYTRIKKDRVLDELFPKLLTLAKLAREYDISLNIDAEEADRLDLSLDLLELLVKSPETADWNGLGFVVQAYQKRACAVIDYLVALARSSRRSLMIRLVKGAYWDTEIKRAQVEGLIGYPVFTRKFHSDLCYLVCAGKMLDASDVIYSQFATHNAHTLASVSEQAADRKIKKFEFQCLHGMGETLYNNVIDNPKFAKPCRIYAPVGSYEKLLPYLVRRLLENGSNSSFVNQLVDENISVDALLADPLTQALQVKGEGHPKIPLPQNLFGTERENSRGVDFSDERTLLDFETALAALQSQSWETGPLIAGREIAVRERVPVFNPANRLDCVGYVLAATAQEVSWALDTAVSFSSVWFGVDVEKRAEILRQMASLLEKNQAALASLCIREAGKTRANAIAEIREAVDFCHYYARQISSCRLPAACRGPVVCISPWNFPLAIFVGQIAAALVSGHTVVAKPAGQTPLIAGFAVRLFHAAGIPPAALQLLPGRGEVIGAPLVGDPRISAVIFTGSLPVARQIHRVIASHPGNVVLVAETGGMNAMVVDSSAHLEQVVQDVISSAFDSAGQRCSALRILCVQEEIAERLLEMLKKAMLELAVGDPGKIDVDIGPVISGEARKRLQTHVDAFAARQRLYFKMPMPPNAGDGHFVLPTVLEIDAPGDLSEEVFGPVLHVLRFSRRNLGNLIDAINAGGFGLTFGIQSRIEETIGFASSRIKAGNIYVNRNMVGAVVGVQPFGGEGKSGTGPKAGGPLYLPRLMDSPEYTLGDEAAERADGCIADHLAQLSAWALQRGRTDLSRRCHDDGVKSLAGRTTKLVGPTGEANRLTFLPRGLVWCRADSDDALFSQIAATLATGNTPLVGAEVVERAAAAMLPKAVRDSVVEDEHPENHPNLACVLFSGPSEARQSLRQQLAGREGEILSVIEPNADGGYPLYRLVKEKVVSVNTASAGGDATLMMLGNSLLQ